MWNRGWPTIYKTSFLFCGSLQLLSTCEHMDSIHAIGNPIVDYGKYMTMMWFSHWKDSSAWVHEYFYENIICKYGRHTHRDQWLDL